MSILNGKKPPGKVVFRGYGKRIRLNESGIKFITNIIPQNSLKANKTAHIGGFIYE